MRYWGNLLKSEMLDAGFFSRPPLSSRPFVHVAIILGVGLAACALVIVAEWGRMPAFMALWIVGVAIWMILLWLRTLRDQRMLRDLFERGEVEGPAPGSPLDTALRVAANTMYFDLFSAFGIAAALILSVGIALALR